jgi:putative selenate reductase
VDYTLKKAGMAADEPLEDATQKNLHELAGQVRTDWRYQKQSFRTDHSKTPRKLGHFDCIEAPCLDECPVDQKVPQYMNAVRDGRFLDAVALTREDNPIPSILGRVCDHLCENTCVRTHLDQPLAIRQMKRFIMDQETQPVMLVQNPKTRTKVAIVGAGPAGIAAAQELGYSGFAVTVFEAHPYAGGMVGGTIPAYRLPQDEIDADMAILAQLGVEVRYNQKAGADFTLEELRSDGYVAVFIAVGAQLAKKLDLDGEESDGILDGIAFLRSVREGNPIAVGPRVGVIGAGDTAMDCVRSAVRVGASQVSLIYRRTVDQMPADPEEIHASIEEGVEVVELARPVALNIESGALKALTCVRNEYRGERDSAKRKIPFEIPDSEFDIELDTLLLAISQHSILDFFGDTVPELNKWGYIEVDPDTHESSIPGVYAGGDVAADGPSSIVKAAADGKLVASAIAESHGKARVIPREASRPVDVADMMLRRGRRQYRTPIEHTPLDQRSGFDETVLGYTVDQAQEEAGRCLDCHEVCSLCVGVCPNMALLTYESEAVRAELPVLSLGPEGVETVGTQSFAADQAFQIAVLSDFCNECGNCVTACPTSGQPYVDKPRLYLNRDEFEAENDNAFMVFSDSSIESRVNGQTHRLVLNGSIQYTTPSLVAHLDSDTLELVEATARQGVDTMTVSLEPAATMLTVMKGLRGSMPHIPVMPVDDRIGTLIGHPGYDE